MQCIISRWRCVWSGRYSRCWVFAWRRVRIVKVSCRLLSRKLWTWMTETLVSNLYKNSYWMYFTHLLLLSLVYISFLLFFFYVFLLSLLFSNSPMLLSCVCQLIINGDDDDDGGHRRCLRNLLRSAMTGSDRCWSRDSLSGRATCVTSTWEMRPTPNDCYRWGPIHERS